MANPRVGVCNRKWSRPSERMATKYHTHLSKCLKTGKVKAHKKGAKRSRLAPAVRRATTCARECNEKAAKRIAHGDRTPKATIKAVCMRKCSERPAPSASVSAPAPVKRDVNALCARYSTDSSVRARCVAGEVGPGLLLRKLAGRAPVARTTGTRLAKRMKRMMAVRRGMIRRAALAAKMKRGAGTRFVLRSPFGTVRKTIGRR